MLSRRALLGHGFALGLARNLLGCAKAKSPSWPRRATYEGVDFIELFPRDADETAPLIVAIHGMGDAPGNWIDAWKTFPEKAQIALPRAFTRYGEGFSWFELHQGSTDEELGAEVGGSEEKLWRGIAKLAGARKVIVTGFSQGGMLTFAIASRHADKVVYAFPMAGSCPGPLLPRNNARAAPLVAFHGTADDVLAFKWGKGAVEAFKAQGNQASMKEYPGVGHRLTPQMRADLWAEIQRVLPLAK